MSSAQIYDAIIAYLIVISSLTLHEWGHAAMADRLGDDTPRSQGRVTLNPIAHMDLVGTVILPLLGIFSGFPLIGWAKPVMINPDNFAKKSARSWVTIAGPAMNLLLALLATLALVAAARLAPDLKITPLLALVLQINVALMVFNLLPIPPLDGSKFLMYWFGMSEDAYANFARYGWIILMVLINIPQTRAAFGWLIWTSLQPFFALASLLA
jgi:Zn-dependent protease